MIREMKGKAFVFGDDIDTDAIIPARYLNNSDPDILKLHVMEDADSEFSSKITAGDIIVAGKNFGCGSSREHAPIAIKAAGISCVIAESFARIFLRNSFNMGLPILISVEASRDIKEGDVLEVNAEEGVIRNITTGKKYISNKLPDFIKEIVEDGGLIEHIKKRHNI
ncbi:MAG TPA: 3-isopropylmalate dehydratase small subunit [Desulfomonilia bacterium]|jgi:3-isopropylmalate/(R)-2-methylmalate dehydratase small subunit